MPRTITETYEYEFKVTIEISDDAPADLFTRGQEQSFKDSLYDHLTTEAEVIAHFAYNRISNGVYDANQLDGWADMEPGLVRLEISDVNEI